MVLKTKIARFTHDFPLAGQCSAETVAKISFEHFLGYEFLARTSREDLLETVKDVFVLFARVRNDQGAVHALEAVRLCIMRRTAGSCAADKRISYEEFRTLERRDEVQFFSWLETTFWSLLFYRPDSWECKTSGASGYTTVSELKKTRSGMVGHAAALWGGGTDDLAHHAFEFLCDCADSNRFKERAKATFKAIKEYKDRYYPSSWDRFELPKEDVKMVLGHIQMALPREFKTIENWGKLAIEKRSPKCVQELFAHAYVKAGGTVF